MPDDVCSITCGAARLEFRRRQDGQGYGYGLAVRCNETGQYRDASAMDNPLVRGRSFNLFPSSARQLDDCTVLLSGVSPIRSTASGKTQDYQYQATVQADPQTQWFRFDVQIDSPAAIPLTMEDGYEPEITLDLGPLPPYERGDHIWFMTLVSNPTKWNDHGHGNDMPATYLYDAYLKTEYFMFFDMTAMSWMSLDNIARFHNSRCGYRRR
jgi:hypothetical protein